MGTIYDKFVNSLARLSKTGYRLPSRVALALSGGVDSVVLLNLLVRYKREIRPDLEIHALTVDHGLRAESTHEARRLQQVVLGEMAYPVAHEVLTIRTPISRRQVERHARDLRYGLLYAYCEQRGIRSVFMGHHLDDQLETYVMRLLSNSTLFGLAGIRPLAPGNLHGRHAVDLVRPLLGVTKADIYGHARAQSLTWFEDRTNADAGLTARNQVRQFLAGEANSAQRREVLELHTKVCALLDECVYSKMRKGVPAAGGGGSSEGGRPGGMLGGMLEDPNLRCRAELDTQLMSLTLRIGVRWEHFRAGLGPIDFLAMDRWIFNQVWLISPSRKYLYGYTKFDSKYSVVEPLQRARSLSEHILRSLSGGEGRGDGKGRGSTTLAGCLFEWTGGDGVEDRCGSADEFCEIRVEVYREHEHRRLRQQAGHTNGIVLHRPSADAAVSSVLYDNRLFIIVGGSSKGARKAAVATDLQDLQCSHELKVQNFNMAQHSVADSLTRQLMLALGLDPELGPDWDLTFRPNWTAGSSASAPQTLVFGIGHMKGARKAPAASIGDMPPKVTLRLKQMLRRLDKAQVPVVCDAAGRTLCFPTFGKSDCDDGDGGCSIGGCRDNEKRPHFNLQIELKRRLLV